MALPGRHRHAYVVALALSAFVCLVSAAEAGTLPVDSVFIGHFTQRDCPAAAPSTDYCYPMTAQPLLKGLGKTTMQWMVVEDRSDPNPDCAHASIALLPIVVAGRGEIDLTAKSSGCQPFADPQTLAYTVIGGSGSYASATGTGVIKFLSHREDTSPRQNTIQITGTIDVPGVSFDTTGPVLSGIKNRTITTSSSKGTRVSFSVRATDGVDGRVPAACKPASGSRFRIGKTRVTCAATDGSGNTTEARFTVTVKRRSRT